MEEAWHTGTEEPVWVAWEGHGKFLGSRHRMRKLLMYESCFLFLSLVQN